MNLKPTTIEAIKNDPILYVSHPIGKMHDIPAITSSCLCNGFCAKMHENPETVCAHCYASSGLAFKTAARLHYERNTELLSSSLIPERDLPRFYTDVARFETHGDWVNLVHAQNEIRIAEYNPQTQFTCWTKRIDLLVKLVKSGIRQPENFHVKVSAPFLNRNGNEKIRNWLGNNGWTVSWFTVCDLNYLIAKYGLDYLRQHGDRVITCGGRDCRSCMRCYGAHPKQDVVELLKQDSERAKRLGVKIGQ